MAARARPSRQLRERGTLSGRRTEDAATPIRATVVELAAAQEGFVTAAQMRQRHGYGSAARVLRAMTCSGELDETQPGVFIHAVANPSASSKDVIARAAWLALEPATSPWQRARLAGTSEHPAVIGGGAAYERWGFGPSVWPADVHLSVGQRPRPDVLDVQYVREENPTADVAWFGPFPYLSAEATLAGSFAYSGDLERTSHVHASGRSRQHEPRTAPSPRAHTPCQTASPEARWLGRHAPRREPNPLPDPVSLPNEPLPCHPDCAFQPPLDPKLAYGSEPGAMGEETPDQPLYRQRSEGHSTLAGR
jgi:hypothetical protein